MDTTTILQNGCEEIQYIPNDAQFVLESSHIHTENSNDLQIIYTDGSPSYLVNGHIIEGGEETLVLQEGEDVSQLLIDNDSGQIVVSDQNLSENQSINDFEYVQYIVEEGDDSPEPSQILYFSEDSMSMKLEELSQQQLEYKNFFSVDQTKVIELDDLLQQSENFADPQAYQYAILKGGKLHIQSCKAQPPAFQISPNNISDTSLITGKNLITGQTVSLDNYIKKHQSSLIEPRAKSSSRSRKAKLSSLLNRTFRLGASVNGKQLVGKVTQVKTNKKSFMGSNENHADADKKDRSQIPHYVTAYEQLTRNYKSVQENSEIIQHLSRTLCDLMDVESIEEKLLEKKLLIMVEERRFQPNKNTFSTKVYYGGGILRSNAVLLEGSTELEKWSFELDFLMKDNNGIGKIDGVKQMFNGKLPDVVKLKLTLTHQKNKTQISVIIEPQIIPGNDRKNTHSTNQELMDNQNKTHYDIWGEKSEDSKQLNEHLIEGHGDDFPCLFDGCDISFGTKKLMLKHFQVHKTRSYVAKHSSVEGSLIRNYQCTICPKAFSSQQDMTVHKKNHGPSKVFGCDICKKAFSRCSNLQRHLTIHHKGSGEMYPCKMCGCSYQYASSLTRHMVQNHIKRQETNINVKH